MTTTPLIREAALQRHQLAAHTRRMLLASAGLVLTAVAVIVVAAPLVLRAFGSEYATQSLNALRLLACASVFRAVISLSVAIWRVEGRGRRIAITYACLLLACILSAIPLGHFYGVTGMAWAWLAGSAAVGVALLPQLLDTAARGKAAPPTGVYS